MSKIVTGLFEDSKAAETAIKQLKEQRLADDLSVVLNDPNSKAAENLSGETNPSGTTTGALAGTAVGGLTGLLTGAATFLVPGLGLLVLGPLASILTGLAGGAVTGGIVGALADAGLSQDKAKTYEESVKNGGILVAVSTEGDNASQIEEVMSQSGAKDTAVGGK